jgi:uncharacterized coiled-coil protein SlyX
MPASRSPQQIALQPILERFATRIEGAVDKLDKRIDGVEARFAQGQYEISEEVQSMFLETRTVMGEMRDEVTKLNTRVGKIERADDIAAGVAEAMKERNAHDTVQEKGALSARAWKPPSWPTVATVGGIGAVVSILANAHAAAVLAGRLLKAAWVVLTGKPD